MKGGGEHRRGRSMGSTTPRSDSKDEDLALFHEMKRREKHNFLHPSPDDLDVSLSSKFGGMGTPAKKAGTDLLTSDVDKNDYDWLLTPPGTPLFPSLDQEAAALGVISPQASLPGSSSANSSKLSHSPADPSPKSTRGNPSPRRTGSSTPNGTMSRSRSTPHNSTSVVATVTRPSTPTSSLTRPSTPTSSLTRPSTPTSSLTRPSTPTAKSSSTPSVRSSTPNLKLSISASKSSSSTASTPTATRPSTPNARSSTPPVRPSTPGARSSTPTSKPSTPTMRRSLSGGKIASSPATTRGGPSPKRTTSSRGNSPSAKRVTPVITTVPGMCSEAPPNLRTTVTERNPSTPKSSSNGSRIVSESGHALDAMDASGRSRRRPRSPSVSRSFSSSSSQDQRTSSQTSRGSVISSYDDGIEVSRPTHQSSRNSAAAKWHAAGHDDMPSGKANTSMQPKRVTKSLVTSSSSSVSGGTPTKKSLEPNKWQGEAYQHSPSSYRHLVASSPGSPFYGSRANSLLARPGSAMNSSVTTSSNASSEHGTTVAPDTEGSERDDDDLLSWDSYGRRMSPSPKGPQADVLLLDKDDEKLGAWQDYERLNGNDLVASYKPGMQSTLDTEVTSFYESDGLASFGMLEQLGLMGEVYDTKKGTSGGRDMERRASNIEDGQAELRRSGEKALQRRASNNEDSRIRDLRRSDDGSGFIRASNNKLGHDRLSNTDQQGLKSKRQELLESLNDTRKHDVDVLKNSGEKALGSQKSKVSSAQIHAACLFVRDFRLGLAPSQGQETTPALGHSSSATEEEAPSTICLGDGGGSIMTGKDFGNVRQTHDFSQQKLKVSGGGSAFAQMESKLPRRPNLRGKVGISDPVVSYMQESSSKADVVHLHADEDDNANSSALSVLVDVMERIKHESSQPKYSDLDNQVSKTTSSTGVVVDGSVGGPSHSEASEIRRGLSYEEIHAMDEVDSPELHDIEDDSLMYYGGKDELELLEILHMSALRKEGRVEGDEVFHESPKRRFTVPDEAEISSLEVHELHESPKRRCVEVISDTDWPTGDAIVLHGSPSFSPEEAAVAVTSMNLDDFQISKHNELEVGEESQILVGSRFQHKEQNDTMLSTDKTEVLSTSEEEIQQSVACCGVKEPELLSSTGVCPFEEEDRSVLQAVKSPESRGVDQAFSNGDMDVKEVSDGKVGILFEVEDTAHTVAGNTPSPSDNRKNEKILPEQTDRVVFDEQCNGSTAVTPDVSYCSEDVDKHVEAGNNLKNESIVLVDAGEASNQQEVGGNSPLMVDNGERESVDQQVLDGKMKENLPLQDDEALSSMSVETDHLGSRMDQLRSSMGSTQEEESTGPHDAEGADEAKIVNVVEVFHSEDMLSEMLSMSTTGEGHQEGAVAGGACGSDAASSEISIKTFVNASKEHQLQDMVKGTPYSEELSLPGYGMAGSEEHEEVSHEGHRLESKRMEDPSPENGNHLVEESDSSESDGTAPVDHEKLLGDSASELASLPKLEGVHDDLCDNFTDGLGNYHISDSTGQSTETTFSGNVNLLPEEPRNDRSVSQSGTDTLRMYNVCEQSPKLHVIEESLNLGYVDTKSVETSANEATSEERMDNEGVSSGRFVEREVVFVHSNFLSSDVGTGVSEVVSEPKSRMSSSLSEMRSASSLCAALEEQLAGLIQKIDSAIEESSKPCVPGQQEGMVGRDKLSARTSELLREQEPDICLEPVRSSQEEDLLDMLWAEDDDSSNSEGSGEDEFSQLNDSRPCGKDGTPNQVNGEIRLSRSSDNGLGLYSNGHPGEVLRDVAKVSSPVFSEGEGRQMESPKSLMEKDHNVNDDQVTFSASLPAGALADTTPTSIIYEDDERAAEHHVSLDQQVCAESTTLNIKDPIDDADDRDTESGKEVCAGNTDSSRGERDASTEEVGDPAHISCLHAPPDDDLSEPVSGEGSLSPTATLSSQQLMTVEVQSIPGEGQRLEDKTCTEEDSVGESVAEFVIQNSAGYKEQAEERSQNSQAGPMAGQEGFDELELSETDVRSGERVPFENLLSAGEPIETRVSETRMFAEEDSVREAPLDIDRNHASEFGLSAEQELIPCDGFSAEGQQSSGGVGDLEEQLLLAESCRVEEFDEHQLMIEGSETTEVPHTEQNLIREEPESLQDRLVVDKNALEALDVPRAATPFSALDNDVAGEGCKERSREEVGAVVEKDSAECAPSLSGSNSPVLNAFCSPEIPVTEASHTKFDDGEQLRSALQLISREDGYLSLDERGLKKDHDGQQVVSEVGSPSMRHDSQVSLFVPPVSSKEQSETQFVRTSGNESEKLSRVCEVPASTIDEDLSNEEMLFELRVPERKVDKETRLSDHSNSISPENVQHSSNVDKAAVTDDEDSFQECISHDSNSLSISRGSLTASSEQEAYSAGTEAAGEDEQEETSQMHFSSSSAVVEGFDSRSRRETLPDGESEDQVTVFEEVGLVDTPEPPSSDAPLDHSEVGLSVDSNVSLQADGVVEVMKNTLAEDPEQLDGEDRFHTPTHATHSTASGSARTCSGSEGGTGESHSPLEHLDVEHAERPLISPLESPACTGSSGVSKSDEAGSVDSPGGFEESSKSVEVQSAELSADKREYQWSPSVFEARTSLSYEEDFITIDDNLRDEKVGGQKSFLSPDRRWYTAECLKQGEKVQDGDGVEQPELQKDLPSSESVSKPTQSLSESEMSQTGNGEDLMEKPKDFEEHAHLKSPSTGKEEVTRSSIQIEVGAPGASPAERATAEAVELKLKEEGDAPSDTGTSDASVVGDQMNGVGSQSARRLPISKAKSVRTISLTSSLQNELAGDGRLSPDGAVPLPKFTAYTSVTVVSPESLQWEPTTRGVPVSGPRDTDDSASAGIEFGNWNAQGVNSSPASVRRALAFMGQQASSFTPIDTCLQSPPTQVFERGAKVREQSGAIPEKRATTEEMKVPATKSAPTLMLSPAKEMKAMDVPMQTVIEVSPKEEVAPLKAPKAKCSCTIM